MTRGNGVRRFPYRGKKKLREEGKKGARHGVGWREGSGVAAVAAACTAAQSED